LWVIVAAVLAASVQAQAAREYYLVGLRHIYMFDVWPDSHKLDRQAIEETYSGALAAGQQQYDTDMASIRDEEAKDGGNIHQDDRDAVQQNLEQDIADAADKRDAALGQLYVECDYVRGSHPEFAVYEDGPYQVMACDVAPTGEFVDVCYFRPYHGYLGPCPFGWAYGHYYPFATFGIQVNLFHSTWLSIGAPVFSPIYHGGVVVNIVAPVRLSVIVGRSAWAGGRPPQITDADRKVLSANKELQRKAGIRAPSTHPGAARRSVSARGATPSKYVRSKSGGAPAGPAPSRYSHTASRPVTGSNNGSASRPPRTSGGGSTRGGNAGGSAKGGASGGGNSRGSGKDKGHGG